MAEASEIELDYTLDKVFWHKFLCYFIFCNPDLNYEITFGLHNSLDAICML